MSIFLIFQNIIKHEIALFFCKINHRPSGDNELDIVALIYFFSSA